MKKKIYYGIVITHLICTIHGVPEKKNIQKVYIFDILPIINISSYAPLDDIENDNTEIYKTDITRGTCPEPFSIQNFVDLHGPFTMAMPYNGQRLCFNRVNITNLHGLQNITNYDIISVCLIGNCILGNTVDESFPDTPFQGLPNTIEIRLAQNNIESLPATFLSGLDQIAYITLGTNQLSSFPNGFFSGHDLLYLGINNNYFSSVDTIDISVMPSLQSFFLNNNVVTSIPENYFQNNTLLMMIDLSKNSLSDWPAATLNNNSNLASLDLSYNQLSDFQPDYLPVNISVILIGNPIPISVQDAIQSKYPEVNFTF